LLLKRSEASRSAVRSCSLTIERRGVKGNRVFLGVISFLSMPFQLRETESIGWGSGQVLLQNRDGMRECFSRKALAKLTVERSPFSGKWAVVREAFVGFWFGAARTGAGCRPSACTCRSADGTCRDDSGCQGASATDGVRGFRHARRRGSGQMYIYQKGRRISRPLPVPIPRCRRILYRAEFPERVGGLRSWRNGGKMAVSRHPTATIVG
jgi:hypothetical protein